MLNTNNNNLYEYTIHLYLIFLYIISSYLHCQQSEVNSKRSSLFHLFYLADYIGVPGTMISVKKLQNKKYLRNDIQTPILDVFSFCIIIYTTRTRKIYLNILMDE